MRAYVRTYIHTYIHTHGRCSGQVDRPHGVCFIDQTSSEQRVVEEQDHIQSGYDSSHQSQSQSNGHGHSQNESMSLSHRRPGEPYLAVSDTHNHRVELYDAAGQHVGTIGMYVCVDICVHTHVCV